MNIIKNITKSTHRFFSILLVLSFLIATPQAHGRRVSCVKKKAQEVITAQAAYAVDYTNRRVLYSRNARLKFYPASTVKLLTALVVLDYKDRKDRVIVSRKAVRVMPTKAGLTQGVYYSVEDLLKVLLATSANDAGIALAEAVADTESQFVYFMNNKAKALGCRDSNFTNATGLPDKKQVTTAYDLSMIARAAFSHPFIASLMRQKTVTVVGSDGKKITRTNHNKMLWKTSDPSVLGKTGYTISAGHCYAGIAYYDDHRVSFVILKSRKPWHDICVLLSLPCRKILQGRSYKEDPTRKRL